MKPDVQKALLATAGRYIRKLFGEVEPRIKALESEAVTISKLLGERIDVLEKALAERPMPEKGDRGEKGDSGQDAEPVLVADVVAELVKSTLLEPVVDLYVAEAVAKHFDANPVQHGRDGKDGDRGPQGDRGEKGESGADGVGYAGEFIDRDGNLTLTKENGQVTKLGVVVGRDGKDGAPGRDGLNPQDFSGEYDAERGFVIRAGMAEFVLPYMVYRGYYREGMGMKAGESITHNGSLWIAKRATAAKPCLENGDDWQLAARQGRDGRDGKDGKPPPGPISLKGDDDA